MDMDVNEHERLSNIILSSNSSKRTAFVFAVLHSTVTIVSSTMRIPHTIK
jgi:hypothetical protein